ncbi:MAG TPA: protein kinase [Thermoanaerobaculia bacterium]|nr:protein kinase [Thermoanaerobaculia bacterium]
MIGRNVAHYRVLDKLGEGGMGAVYLAEDTRLQRQVALKMLSHGLAGDADFLGRFRREAQAVAALNHPNIVTIHSIEECDDGHFLTMELVQGKSLDRLITGDGLSAQRVVEIALPLARALAAAHERGITHRDLKPANIMVGPDGLVKILDFGLAKLRIARGEDEETQALTKAGQVMGTVPYMSPEQVQGLPADHRSDIFSLGVILFEMCTGQRPFRGDSSAHVISAILRDPPRPMEDLRSDLPEVLVRIVGRCLEKDPELRYQSSRDIETALAKLSERVDQRPAGDGRSVAVLPFVDMSPEKDQEYFCEGLAEELINALVAIEGLRTASRTSAFRFKGGASDIREIGRRLGVSTVLEGSVRKAGSKVRISVQLVDVEDGYHLWSNRYDRELEDVFEIQDEIAQKVVEALQVTLRPKDQAAAEKAAPADVQAYDYYLKGRKFFYEFRAKGFELARQMFARAIVIDERYARAYAGVADCCSFLYMYYDASAANLKEADTASRKAVEMDPNNAEAHASRGLALSVSGKYEEGEREFLRAIELNPKLYEARYFFGRMLVAQGRHDEACQRFEEACKVNPEDYQAPFFLAQTYLSVSRRAHAAAAFRRAVEAAKKHVAFHGDDVRALYLGAGGLVELGEMEVAKEWVARALEIEPDDNNTLYNVACVYAMLGETEPALDCLSRAIVRGFGFKEWIDNDPYFDPLRRHPRFQELMSKLHGVGSEEKLDSQPEVPSV